MIFSLQRLSKVFLVNESIFRPAILLKVTIIISCQWNKICPPIPRYDNIGGERWSNTGLARGALLIMRGWGCFFHCAVLKTQTSKNGTLLRNPSFIVTLFFDIE